MHRHYLVPLAGHSEVIAVVLNQADLLGAAEVEECASDLRRLLDSEGLHNASLFVTSAVTGAGVDQLRKLLTETVYERKATAARISADLDDVAADFAPHATEESSSIAIRTSAVHDVETRPCALENRAPLTLPFLPRDIRLKAGFNYMIAGSEYRWMDRTHPPPENNGCGISRIT